VKDRIGDSRRHPYEDDLAETFDAQRTYVKVVLFNEMRVDAAYVEINRHKVDRLGGARVALVSVTVEVTGLALTWLAQDQTLAVFGAMLTGCGFALVYPALGVEAVRRVPPQSHTLAMGAYTAFLDVALGFGSPALGLVAGWAGLRAAFLATALIVLGAAVVALRLLYAPASTTPAAQTGDRQLVRLRQLHETCEEQPDLAGG
jgi:predicted MFS family arabinose efflux permease